MVEKSSLFTDYFANMYNDNCIDFAYNNVFPTKDTLVYCFSEDMCEECIMQDLNILSEYKSLINNRILIVVALHSVNRTSQILWHNRLDGFNYKLLQNDLIHYPKERETDIEQRFLTFVDILGRNYFIFIPCRGKENMTIEYLRYINRKFLSQIHTANLSQ